ncbi:hypothetical protein DOM22_07070 [Bdellovibrio sp. ZAP7]|uniref:hypothetical protein n=1 Tax=Bdellovibrio sp. ZAP7 TaxID=2231053 RepID=UPI00115C1201|nr:hypothetical protein [Bdellovibrio sp. ZAP7]QDK44940.1 hypothetical protein DOM22_07070 [Bdellovibrio sp. ZAP7]
MAQTTDQMVSTGKSTYNKTKDAVNSVDFNDAKQAASDYAADFKDSAMEYADKAVKIAKKNPLYVAAGAAGLGLLIGGLLMRGNRKN